MTKLATPPLPIHIKAELTCRHGNPEVLLAVVFSQWSWISTPQAAISKMTPPSFHLLIPLLSRLLLQVFQPPAAAAGQDRSGLLPTVVSGRAITPPQLLLGDPHASLPPAAAVLQGGKQHGPSLRSGANLVGDASSSPGP